MENKISRRAFVGHLTGAFAGVAFLGSSIFTSGCSAGDVLKEVLHWVPVGLQSFNAIITLLEGSGVINVLAGGPIAALVGIIQTGFNDLVTDINQYKAIQPPPAGAMAKIDTVLGLIVTNFQQFLTSINIADPKLSLLVVGLSEIILSTISGFINALPSSVAMPKVQARLKMEVKVGQHTLTYSPVRRTIPQYRKEWNKVVVFYGHKEMQQHVKHVSVNL